jgi:hypothetical protein
MNMAISNNQEIGRKKQCSSAENYDEIKLPPRIVQPQDQPKPTTYILHTTFFESHTHPKGPIICWVRLSAGAKMG